MIFARQKEREPIDAVNLPSRTEQDEDPMRLAWTTDIHLNFVAPPDRQAFYQAAGAADAVLITGDIAESPTVAGCLKEMEQRLGKPIFFVLGNHDFYKGSIVVTRLHVSQLCSASQRLVYLSQAEVVELTPNTALVGHDGWADARFGDFANTEVILNDFRLIAELQHWHDPWTLDKATLQAVLQTQAGIAAEHLERVLPEAAARYAQVIVATHVPPFREAAWHRGGLSDDAYLPYFSSKVVGEVLLAVARAHAQCTFLVLCGHTHGSGALQVLDNLRVLTGAAEYGKPEVQQLIDVE
jgi:predicted MPP superfamily phosphohydrolase